MAHTYYHCGIVQPFDPPQMSGDLQWPMFSKGLVAWHVYPTAPLQPNARKKLERRLLRRAFDMAEYIDDWLGGGVGDMEVIDGDYCAIGVGSRSALVTIPSFQIGRDGLVTHAFHSEGITHAEASAVDTWLSIQRYEMYLDIHRATGGEIKSQY